MYEEILESNNFLNESKNENEEDEIRDFAYEPKLDLIIINYLNYVLKNESLENFRKKFSFYRQKNIGPYVYLYVALAEFNVSQNKTVAFNIFTVALKKFPKSTLLLEEFFLFFIRIGDEENARALFERLDKTDRMWDAMLDYVYKYGDISIFRKLTSSRKPRYSYSKQEEKSACEGSMLLFRSYYESFGFYDLSLDGFSILYDFNLKIPKISKLNDIYVNAYDSLIELLTSVSIK